MKVVTEHLLSDEQLQYFDDHGVEVYMYLPKEEIERGEAVGFYLSKFKPYNADLIGYLLATKHNVSIKFKDKSFKLTHIDEWRKTIQDPKDQIKTISIKHPILEMFDEKRREKSQKRKDYKAKLKYNALVPDTIPEDLDEYIQAFAPRYGIDYEDTIVSKYQAYQSIKFYIEHNIEYSSPAPVIEPDETPLFGLKFNFEHKSVEEPDIESFGDEIYMEDFINKSLQLD